jgi:hypothetical protein
MQFLDIRVAHWIIGVCLWILCMLCATSEAALALSKDLAVNLLQIETPTDIGISSVFIGINDVINDIDYQQKRHFFFAQIVD